MSSAKFYCDRCKGFFAGCNMYVHNNGPWVLKSGESVCMGCADGNDQSNVIHRSKLNRPSPTNLKKSNFFITICVSFISLVVLCLLLWGVVKNCN